MCSGWTAMSRRVLIINTESACGNSISEVTQGPMMNGAGFPDTIYSESKGEIVYTKKLRFWIDCVDSQIDGCMKSSFIFSGPFPEFERKKRSIVMASAYREVQRLLGKGIYHYGLIEDGDKIAVGVSGGKDSMLLLWLLRERLRRVPISYELTAVHVDPGFDSESADQLEEFFTREGFEHEIVRTDHGPRAHGPQNRENPCFLCARLRRAVLFRKAGELGCSKIALGHNQDDMIETFFINICYGAQISGMVPKQEFFEGKMTVIRPFALVPAQSILKVCNDLGLPILKTKCPSASHGGRTEIRNMLDGLFRKNSKVRGNIYHAMSNINTDYLPPGLPVRGRRSGRGRKPGDLTGGVDLHEDLEPTMKTAGIDTPARPVPLIERGE